MSPRLLTPALALLLPVLAIAAEPAPSPAAPLRFDIRLDEVRHTMAGGLGASWHAMGPDVVHYPDLIGRDNRACKGSAYGGNPPVLPAFDQAWADVVHHARWLGLDFVRVEVAMDMYHPEPDRFDWDNDQVRTLHRILDHCQTTGVDVYMTMQWNGVAWNAHPGVNRLQSSPRSVPAFAASYATLVERLVKQHGYTCIRWLTVNNEPGMAVGWWQGPEGKPDTIMPAVRALRAELDRRELRSVALCGSDGHDIRSGSFEPADPAVGALSIHSYWGKPAEMFAPGLALARQLDHPFFVAEMGTFFMGEFEGENMAMGGPRSEAPKSYAHQLLNAEKVLVGLNLGVDGLIRWSFVNRGDLDGQWQLIRTWNPNTWDFKKRATPEPVPYHAYGILTRFSAKHSAVLATTGGTEQLIATTLRSPGGQLTIFLLNLADQPADTELALAGLPAPLTLRRYEVTEPTLARPDYTFTPLSTETPSPAAPTLRLTLPPKSITALTTYDLAPDAAGAIRD